MIKKIWTNFIKCGQSFETSSSKETQMTYVNTFSAIGISAFLIFGIVHLFFGKIYLGFLELFLSAAGIINVIVLRKTHNFKIAGSIILAAMALALTGFFIDGGYANTGIYWYYTFPLLAFFLKGKRGGICWVVGLYLLTIVTGIFFHFILSKTLIFSYIQIQQMLMSLLAVSMLVYFYEKIREENDEIIKKSQLKIIEKKLLEEEIKISEGLQRSLLQQKNLILEDIDFVGFYKPSLGVSGDYYDYFQINENQIASVLCDVSGKGIPAAFVMVNIRAVFKTLIKKPDENLQSIAHSLNTLMNQEVGNSMFTTFFAFIYSRKEKEATFYNAGHGPFTYYSSKKNQIIETDLLQLPLGVVSDLALTEEVNIKLDTNDIIVLFSDGITEALNTQNDEFGKNKLFEIILKNKDLKANDICRAIIKEIKYFSKDALQRDDISLIIAKVK